MLFFKKSILISPHIIIIVTSDRGTLLSLSHHLLGVHLYLIVEEGLELGVGREAGLVAQFLAPFTFYLLYEVRHPTHQPGLYAGILGWALVNIGLPARFIEVVLVKGEDFLFEFCLSILVILHLLLLNLS